MVFKMINVTHYAVRSTNKLAIVDAWETVCVTFLASHGADDIVLTATLTRPARS
jgi:hypothetical protein